MKKWKKPIFAGISVLGLCIAGLGINAIAAPPDQGQNNNEYGCYGMGPGMGYGMGPGMGGPGRGYGRGNQRWNNADPRMAEHWKERIAQRQTEMHRQLKLTPEQEPAWKDYNASITSNFGTPPKWNPDDFAKMTPPERMEKMLEFRREQDRKMEAHLSAFKTFYGKLSPEQQKIFDMETNPYYRRGGRGPR